PAMPKRKRPSLPPLAAAIREARYVARLDQKSLGARVGASARSIMRWESGQATPTAEVRAGLVEWANGLPAAARDPLLEGLGVASAAVVAPTAGERRRMVNDALHAFAEELDVGPRTLRG